jgi:hypothetical protein
MVPLLHGVDEMAVRIIPYEQQTAPSGSTDVPHIPVDQSAGAGFSAIGDALGAAGSIVNKIADDESRAEAAKAISQKEIDDAADFQKQSQAAISDPNGFGTRYIQSYDERTTAWLDQYSGKTRKYLDQMTPQLRSKYGQQAIGYEFDARKIKTVTDLQTAMDNTMTSVFQGNVSLADGRAQGNALVGAYEQSGYADPTVAAKMRAGINSDSSWYSLQGQITRGDPSGALRRMGVNPSTAPIASNDSAKYVYDQVAKQYGSVAAAAIVGNLQQESQFNTNAVHDGGTGLGIAGWRDPQAGSGRKTALLNFAASNKMDPSDIKTQTAFLLQELGTTESKTGNALKTAKTLDEANKIAIGYFRPRGYTDATPEQGDSYSARAGYSKQAAEAFGGDNAGLIPSPELKDLTPEQAMRVESAARTEQKSQMAEYRATFEAQVNNDITAFANGDAVSTPKTQDDFFKAYPPQDAVVQYQDYSAKKDAGVAMAGFKSMSSGQIATSVEALRPVAGTSDYAVRANAYAAAVTGAQETFKQRAVDPVGYVSKSMRNVGNAWTDYANAPSDVSLGRAIAVSREAQNALGIASGDQKAVPNSVRQSMVRDLESSAPSDVYKRLHTDLPNALGQQGYTDLMQTLSTGDNALSRDYQTLATIDDPVAGQAFVTALTAARKNGQSVREAALQQMGPDDFKSLQNTIASNMNDYIATLKAQGAAGIVQQQLDAATAIAVYAPSRSGGPYDADMSTTALTKQYDIVNAPGKYVARAPRGAGIAMQKAADYIVGTLNRDNLQFVGGDPSGAYPNSGLPDETMHAIQSAQWVTSPRYDGWTLVPPGGKAIRYKDGSPVVVRFAELPTYSKMFELERKSIQNDSSDDLVREQIRQREQR